MGGSEFCYYVPVHKINEFLLVFLPISQLSGDEKPSECMLSAKTLVMFDEYGIETSEIKVISAKKGARRT